MANFIFYELLPVILNMSLTACVVILCVLLARLCLKKAPKVFSYALWAVVLFRLLCPVSVNSEFSLLGLLDTPAVEATEHTTVIEYVPQTIVTTPAPQVQMPPSTVIPTMPSGGVTTIPSTGTVSSTPVDNTPSQTEEPTAQPQEIAMAIATFAWLGGILVMAAYSVISYNRLKRRLVGAVRLRENIYLADHIGSPFVMGIFRPKIYLPSSLPEQEQHYIILHEQHHIRRGDHVLKALAFVALCIHWFNPLVWLAFVLSGKDMEMSCDEAVVKKLGEDIRTDYSASLLSLATGQRIIAGTPLAFGEGDTKSRIKNMLNWKRAKLAVIFLSAAAVILVLLVCVTNPKTDEPTDDEQTNEEQSEKEHPAGSLEAFLADLHGDDIAEVEWLIEQEARPANTEVAALIRNAINHGEVFRQPPGDGVDGLWWLSLRIAESDADWNSDDMLHLRVGLEENIVEIDCGANLPDGPIWAKDEALYRLVRTSLDTPDNTTIDAEALAAYRDIVDAYLARETLGPPVVESAYRELLGFYQVAEREDLGAKIYCIDTVTIVEPAEKAPYLLAGGAYVDSQLRIHPDSQDNLLVVIDGEPVGSVNWMWLEIDHGLENCASREDLIRAAQNFGGVVEVQQGLPLELYTGEVAAGDEGKFSIQLREGNPYFVTERGERYRLPLPYADEDRHYAALENSQLNSGDKTISYEATVPEHVLASDGSVLSRAGTYHYTVDLNALTYTVRFVTTDTELPYAPQTFVTALLQMEDVGDLLDDYTPTDIYYDLDTYEYTDTDPISCYVYYDLTRPEFAAFREAFEARTGGAPDADTSWVEGAWNETGGDGRDIARITVSGMRSRAEIARLTATAGWDNTEYAPTGVVLTDVSALWGEWQLDEPYTESANGVGSLQKNFGTSLEEQGARLTIGSGRSLTYSLGVLSGEGMWQPDGDTGRYEATVTLSPDGGEKHLTFYTFRQSGDSAYYLVMDYGEYVLYWTRNAVEEEKEPTAEVTELLSPTFENQPIQWRSPLNGMFERTYETQLQMLGSIDRTSPPFFKEQTIEFDTCAVVLGRSLDLETGTYFGTGYILFRDGALGRLTLPKNADGITVLPETVTEQVKGVLSYRVGQCAYTVDLENRSISMNVLSPMPSDDDIHAAIMANYNGPKVTDVEYPVLTATHHVFSIEQENDTCTVYAMAYYQYFEWYNGRQKWLHFNWQVPVKMVFRSSGADYWHLTDFWCSENSDNYADDIQSHFPAEAAEAALNRWWDSALTDELNARVYASAAAYYATLSDLPGPKVFTAADVEFSGQALNFKETDKMRYSERLEWVRSGAADSENKAYVSAAQYLEGTGILAYVCQWVGTPHLGQYVFNLRFADGSTALLPLPREGYYASALPDAMEFYGGKFIYEKTFTDDLFSGEAGEYLIHLKGTYHYEVDLNAKTISLKLLDVPAD